MKKKSILLFFTLCLCFISINFNVQAEEIKDNNNDEIIVFESVSYYEMIYENGTLKEQRKLNKKDYEAKVKKEKSKRNKAEKEKTNPLEDDISMMMVSCGDGSVPCTDEGGGGTTYYTISFNSNGGTPVSSITKTAGTTITKPTDPTKTNYVFGGWYSDSSLTQPYAFTTMPSYSITLYAKWHPTTQIEENTNNNLTIDCKSEFYSYCEGSASWGINTTSYSKVKTTVYLDPSGYQGKIKSELTWDIMPNYRLDDVMSVGWDKSDLSPDFDIQLLGNEAIQGKQEWEYEEVKEEWYNYLPGCETCWSTRIISTETGTDFINYNFSELGGNHFGIDENGVIFGFNLKNNYDYYDGQYFNTVSITSIKISLEVYFININLDNGNYVPFRDDFSQIIFSSDYKHIYDQIDLVSSFSAGIGLEGPSASITILSTVTKQVDGSRLIYITQVLE